MRKMNSLVERVQKKIQRDLLMRDRQRRERSMAYRVAAYARFKMVPHPPSPVDPHVHPVVEKAQAPVIFFNASTRLTGMSYNAAYHQLAAWALRLQGVPVIHFVCRNGMSRCVQGTNRDNHLERPPCKGCVTQSRALYAGAEVAWFGFQSAPDLEARLAGLSVAELMDFKNTPEGQLLAEMPLGALVAPGIRWVLRRYRLIDDEPTRFLYRQFILSAWNIAREFSDLLETRQPRAVVLFNGTFFPEAAVRWVARQHAVPVITHESAFLPFTAFFTTGEATAYPLDPPEDFALSPVQDARLDAYLEQRFKGNFSMAGIRFWPEIKGLDEAFMQKMAGFRQMVPVFTNVIFDTSQGHANVIFDDMFVWLDQLLEVIRFHSETLFVIRAHPDEGRIGKASRETVADWVRMSGANQLPNVLFIDSNEYISSYELVERSKFVLVYNSMIGLESSILNAAVLSGGKVRYHTDGCRTIYLPGSIPAYFELLEDWLAAAGRIEPSPELRRNARRFLYYQIFYSSLSFEQYLQAEGAPGFVGLRKFPLEDLLPEKSATMRVLVDGILKGTPFLLSEDQVMRKVS